MENIINKTVQNLEKNGMQVLRVKAASEIVPLVKTLINKGDSVSCGGSVSINESGVTDLISNGDYVFYNRSKAGITETEKQEVYRNTTTCDAYFCSSNAITENGELVNVDGFGNRCASIIFGPKSVIMVVSANKIVPDINAAFLRIKTLVAPKNCVRLGLDTYCAKMGECASIKQGTANDITAGCSSDKRICCSYVISGSQKIRNRIKIILCDEALGY